jgi:uncharacterized membrane protein/thiol-disulfide isomerase/thioredoxin
MKKIILVLLIAFFVPFNMVHAQTEQPVVHAVLFYSPTCGHCEFVINQTILPMMDKYGEQLQVIGIDVTQKDGQSLFMSAMQMFNLEKAGVPFLVIDDMYLIGSGDIPEQFPSLVKTYLAQGGVDYPNIPGLQQALGQASGAESPTATSLPQSITAESQVGSLQTPPVLATVSSTFPSPTTTPGIQFVNAEDANWTDRFAHDPVGNTLAVIVLLGMFVSFGWVIATIKKKEKGASLKENWAWIIPLLSVIGFGVAGYLAYVETTQTTAVCGPVGDCNTVQQSEYARLFGILPIGVLGLLGYIAILISWLLARFSKGRMANLSVISLFAFTIFGTLFSIYLTFLEPFVIGATCAWCLTSAILMTILMLLTVGPVKNALAISRPRHHVR